MTFKTGMWGKQAKIRSKKRLEYFKIYRRNKIQVQKYTYTYKLKMGMNIPKDIRTLFLKEKEVFCQICGYKPIPSPCKGVIIHHKDFCNKNNNFDNLLIVCRSCHNKIHNKHRREEKWQTQQKHSALD